MSAPRILMVDDSPADRASVRIAFEQAGFGIDLSFAENTTQAMGLLRDGARPQGHALPHLVLLDIHMPGGSGLDLLAAMKKDKSLCEIPVWMLSGTNNRRDIRAAYRRHASGFFRKPDDFDGLRRLADLISRLCLEALAFPGAEN